MRPQFKKEAAHLVGAAEVEADRKPELAVGIAVHAAGWVVVPQVLLADLDGDPVEVARELELHRFGEDVVKSEAGGQVRHPFAARVEADAGTFGAANSKRERPSIAEHVPVADAAFGARREPELGAVLVRAGDHRQFCH